LSADDRLSPSHVAREWHDQQAARLLILPIMRHQPRRQVLQGARQPAGALRPFGAFSGVGALVVRQRSCRALVLVVEQAAVVDVGDDLGAVGGGVEAVEAQHHDCGPALSLRSHRRLYGPPA
jgi:hypothetical protein